jgi:hypothetical protein
MKFVAAAVRALSSSIALAQKTAPGDRVYVLHDPRLKISGRGLEREKRGRGEGRKLAGLEIVQLNESDVRAVRDSQAQGTCPALDWHIVATPGGVLSGMLAWPDQKMVARVSGSIVPHVKAERSGRAFGQRSTDPGIPHDRFGSWHAAAMPTCSATRSSTPKGRPPIAI